MTDGEAVEEVLRDEEVVEKDVLDEKEVDVDVADERDPLGVESTSMRVFESKTLSPIDASMRTYQEEKGASS